MAFAVALLAQLRQPRDWGPMVLALLLVAGGGLFAYVNATLDRPLKLAAEVGEQAQKLSKLSTTVFQETFGAASAVTARMMRQLTTVGS